MRDPPDDRRLAATQPSQQPIRPDALDRIFERFYTDRPQQSFGQNSGLGLSISKQIVEAHGGRLAARNRTAPPDEEGEVAVLGACFTVHLRVL